MMTSLYKTRSKKLKELGFGNYEEYLASPLWQRRRAEYAATHERRCRYCDDGPGDHLHHRRYRNLGAEEDDDLEWVCAAHHAEITKFGSIQPATERQRAILRGHQYPESVIARMTFGAAYELIGNIGCGVVQTPLSAGLRPPAQN